MNKFFLFFLFFCLEIGKSDVIIKKKENSLFKNDKLEQYIIKGKIFNISKYSNYERITINTDEERKRIILNQKTNFKDNDTISVICLKYEFGEYNNCNLIY